MRGAAMSFTAAACWFVVFLLSVSGVQGWYDWGVTCSSTKICALKGSTVEMSCTYRYPPRENTRDTTVEEKFWFTKLKGNVPVDLRTEYSGRMQYSCQEKSCTLRITDLRESDSAEYKLRFITNQPDGTYTSSPGVTLSVTDLEVRTWSNRRVDCHSSCRLPGHPSYIWYRNGQKIQGKALSYFYFSGSDDKYYNSYSCAVRGHEDVPSSPVCVNDQKCNRVMHTDRSICAFKGSSVDISCTYNSHYTSFTSKFWFSPERSDQWQSPSQPAGRVQVLDTNTGRSTLRISDLKASDSTQYHFKFIAGWFEWRSILPGTTLTVTDPDLQVQVIRSSTGPKLICHSSCLSDRSSFIWYRNETEIRGETSPFYSRYINPGDHYSCAYKNYRSASVYAPMAPLVLMSSPGDIMKDSSVTLTCSSDANPAAKYTWYKKNGDPDPQPLRKEAELVFRSIQSSDSGEYYCTAENELGRRTSESISINVKYGPKISSVSVSPSGEIVENSSVTLTCSSDANPAAKYTWYKENQTLGPGPQDIYHFTSINSKNSGVYHCKSENQYGQINSSSVLIDVKYAPKLPSVSVSPSGEIVEGSLVSLTCSSDANPAANYTWYKENEDSPKAPGQIFTIIDFRPEHSGNYYCEAQNRRGRHNSTLHLIVVAGAWKSVATGMVSVVLLFVILLAVFLWMRRNKSVTQTSKVGERPDNSAQLHTSPVYGNMLAVAQRQPEEEEDDLNYSNIQFSLSQQEALYSNYRPAQPHRQIEDEDEEEGVDYTPVKTDNNSSASGTRQEDGEDLFALYSTVNKNNLNTT